MLLVSFLVFQRFFSAFAMTKDCCKDTNFFGNNAKRGEKERRKLLQQGAKEDFEITSLTFLSPPRR
jgi:hypothetical protein